jgi:hypothetical protein
MNTKAIEKPLAFDRPRRGRIYDRIAETIGNTPLVRILRSRREEGMFGAIARANEILATARVR